MTKKILALVLALVMVFAMTACTSTEEPAESPAATDDAGTESTEPTASADSGEVVNLLYYEIGNQDTNSREAVQEAINAYIEPLIGANVEFRIVSWADWDSRALTALQSGEEIDLFFTADWKQYTRSVMQGLFTALNDDNGAYGNLLETYGQDITNSLNPLFITGTQIDGINYAVPVNKELAVPNGYIVNLDAAEEVGMDPTTITGIADLEPYLAAYKELHPEQYPYVTDRRWCEDPWSESFVAGLNFNLLSTYLSPNEHEAAILAGHSIDVSNGINMEDVAVVSQAFQARGVENLIITMGENGSIAAGKNGIHHTHCVKMEHVADPTAAGDSFVAAFCTGLTAGLPQGEALAFASHTAAITVSRMGAMPSLPMVEEVQQLLVERDYQGFDPAELDALKQ